MGDEKKKYDSFLRHPIIHVEMCSKLSGVMTDLFSGQANYWRSTAVRVTSATEKEKKWFRQVFLEPA